MMARGTGIVQAETERAARWLSGHLRYLQYRQRSPEESPETRSIFSATCDRVRQGVVLSTLIGRARQPIIVHKLMLSAEDEQVADWRDWTRQAMCLLREQERQALCWFGVLHHNTDTPHVHIVLARLPRPLPMQTEPALGGDRRPSLHPLAQAAAWTDGRAEAQAEEESSL